MTFQRHGLTLAFSLVFFSFSTSGFAESPSEDQKRAARAAAEAGYEAMVAGDYESALTFLARAENDYHAPTHVLMIAEAHEKLGQLVEAREALLSVIHERVENTASDAFLEAKEKASDKLAELEPRVPRLTITVELTRGGQSVGADQGEVYLNQVRVPTSAYDAPYPVNPGTYQVSIRLDDTEGESVALNLKEGEVSSIELRCDAPARVLSEEMEPDTGDEGTHPMAYVGFGVGGLGIIAGSITGAIAMSTVSNLKKDHCQGTQCDPEYQDEFSSAEKLGWVSTASFAVGASGIALGVYYLLTGNSEVSSQDASSRKPQVDVVLSSGLAYTHATWAF